MKRCTENIQQNYWRTFMQKSDFKATLLKSRFGTGVLLEICYIFSEHLFPRTPLEGIFCIMFDRVPMPSPPLIMTVARYKK